MKNTLKGKWVIDSQLMVYGLDEDSPFYPEAQKLFYSIYNGQIEAYCALQNIIETENTLIIRYKQPIRTVIDKVNNMLEVSRFIIISPLITTYQKFHLLIKSIKYNFDLYDHFLAATMLDNGMNRLLTVNTKDFSKIPGIEAVNPFK